jgi:FMN phosphatase YigB (HAD superfamily)
MKATLKEVKALVFDVFGTVVDWRASTIAEGRALGRKKRLDLDWGAFADPGKKDVTAEKRFDLNVKDFGELAAKLGCR